MGAIFETHVVLESRRMFSFASAPVNFYHWRAHSGAEVDLVIERDGMLWPVEIKARSAIHASDTRGLQAFRAAYADRCATAIMIAAVKEPYFFSPEILVIPFSLG